MRTLLSILFMALLTACSDSADVGDVKPSVDGVRHQLDFSVYMGRTATARSCVGPIDTERLKQPDCGFGVFAYMTGQTPYSDFRLQNAVSRRQPDFLNHEPIRWNDAQGEWQFADGTAVRSWPGDTLAKVSFFAYAPYMDDMVIASDRTDCFDPAVHHQLSPDMATQTDLLWGTDPYGDVKLVDGQRFAVNADLTSTAHNGIVSIAFKHALSKIGGPGTNAGSYDEDVTTAAKGLMAVLDIDEGGPETGATLQPYDGGPSVPHTPYNTKVTIHAVRMVSSNQPDAGVLNLATGEWTHVAPVGHGLTRSQQIALHEAVAEPDVHPGYSQQGFESLPIGVTTVPKNVCTADVLPMLFIPGTCPAFDITVDYTVRTYDAQLTRHYSEVRQRMTRRLTIMEPLELNKQYNILMHIGLTSVKFTATVEDWTPEGGSSGSDDVDIDDEEVEHVWLPTNVD